MQKKKTVVRLTINAMLIAIYIVLSLPIMTLNVGGLKFTFEHFPVVLCAVLFGPIDGIIVGTLGELVNQMTTFGITPTTALWILPIAFRGCFMGLGSVILKKVCIFVHPSRYADSSNALGSVSKNPFAT